MLTTTSIPDDGSMEAALYGTAHIETILNRDNGEHLLRIYESRIATVVSDLNLELAETIIDEAPELIYSEDELDPTKWPNDIVEIVTALRTIAKLDLASNLVEGWLRSADHRGRLIGLGEHSARVTVSGSADTDFKMASMKYGGI